MSDYHSFDPALGHGLPHDPIKAIIAPRPIGWISSIGASGVANLAPYSYFNMFSHKPPILIFGSEGRKDTLSNVVQSGAFVFNLATQDLAQQMNQSSGTYPPLTDEFEMAGLGKLNSDTIAVPRVADAAAAMECRVLETRQLHDLDGQPVLSHLIIGQVTRVHIRADLLLDGRFDMVRAGTIARCGYRGDYVRATQTFEMLRPQIG
ncbi:flavin reductase family protein [Devosia salina]|uniref:Flavin reductase family protein n=1 Tax=Devosia salina TaxID=2860336 RepID=A0ABX8WQ01_9HYPH|nr:flavin reductase family protein [Devosia salina]QYO78890.1 flavin reductase family protein [Devosia salina]